MIVLALALSMMVLPFAYNRPIDLLKMWLGVLTVVQLLQIYAMVQMTTAPNSMYEGINWKIFETDEIVNPLDQRTLDKVVNEPKQSQENSKMYKYDR